MRREEGPWIERRLHRRAALRAAAVGGGGLAALSLIACGGSSGSDGGTSGNQVVQSTPAQPPDSTKGKRGGTIRIQGPGHPGTLTLVATNNASLANLAGFTHSGLLIFKNGRPIAPQHNFDVEPDLAESLPEQPDQLTFAFKLRDAKFHNGRTVTSDDIKYTFERFASWEKSGYKPRYAWLDRVETPDPKKAVIKTRTPYADAIRSMAMRFESFIMSKEHEEGPQAGTKLVGSGPFLFEEDTPPVITRFKRNPDYFMQPYPYFDQVDLVGNTDAAKKIADFIARQILMSYWHSEEERDQIKRGRPDALPFSCLTQSFNVYIRCDQPPFNDPRVREALALTVDRKAIRQAVSKGEGDDDQVFSVAGRDVWGFRKPSELGGSGKYWTQDVAEAKKLLAAAGVTQPIEAPFSHWNATVIPGIPESATLLQAKWRELGIANFKDVELTFAQAITTIAAGNYDGVYLYPSQFAVDPVMGISLRAQMWSPPDGVKAPTTNTGHINDPQLSELSDKQLTQLDVEERKKTLRQMEEIMAAQQYRIALSTYTLNWFLDPSVKNAQVPSLAYNGAMPYIKYWWFA